MSKRLVVSIKVVILYSFHRNCYSWRIVQVCFGNRFDLALEVRRGLLEIGHLDVLSAIATTS